MVDYENGYNNNNEVIHMGRQRTVAKKRAQFSHNEAHFKLDGNFKLLNHMKNLLILQEYPLTDFGNP